MRPSYATPLWGALASPSATTWNVHSTHGASRAQSLPGTAQENELFVACAVTAAEASCA